MEKNERGIKVKMKKRNIIYIVISVICIIAIIMGVYYQIFADKVVSENAVNNVANEIEEEKVDNPEDLLAEFNNLFTNTFYKQGYDTSEIKRMTGYEEQEVIYAAFNIKEEMDEKYSIDINVPVFNVYGDISTEFNGITQSVFADKANSILSGTDKYTIYSIDYVAYLNDNILSLVIKSTLKEGNSAQRIIVQTYNCNVETGEKVTLNEVLEEYGYTTKEVNKKIDTQVKEASKQAEAISEATGQTVYKRDIDNAMYVTDNVNNFFVGEDGQIYIVYAYGNNNVTSEIDIIKL
jgi:hypothetical protein